MNIDDKLQQKKNLIEEAKKLNEEQDLAQASRKARVLERKWRHSEDESFLESELEEEFNKIINEILEKSKEFTKDVETTKKEIIAKAKEVAKQNNLKQATASMNELFDEWKQAGYTNKELDDALWNEFNTVRQEFYDKKAKRIEEFKQKAASAEQTKREIIEKAKALVDATNFKKASDDFNALMEEWKAAGRTTQKELDDELWNEFSSARKAFNERRNEYFAKLKVENKEKAKQKEEIIEKAKAIVEKNEYSKEITDSVKQLREDWKKVGFVGKELDDQLYKQFNEVVNQYFDGLKENNKVRHEEYVARMQDNIAYKKQQIEKIQKEIRREEMNAKESLRESAVAEANEIIAEKNEFIAKLENDIKEIEEKIK